MRCEFSSLYVHPDYWSRGVGEELLNQAIEFLGEGEDIYLDVVDYNAKAIRFYEKHGFVNVGPTPNIEEGAIPSRLDPSTSLLMLTVRMFRKGKRE